MVDIRAAEIGDYVLATKYDDGDPCDHFYVGFVCGFFRDRYLVADHRGVSQRSNGFRRVEKISIEEGQRIVALIPEIGDLPGRSLWWHLKMIRSKIRGRGVVMDSLNKMIERKVE